MHGLVYQQGVARHDLVFLSRYQEAMLVEAQGHLRRVKEFLRTGISFDMVNASLKAALDNFGRLTGEVGSEELLNDIFGRFCIGK